MAMLCAAIGKGRHRREWVFGLRWVRQQSQEAGPAHRWSLRKLSAHDATLKETVQRAAAGGDPGFAWRRVSDGLLVGWPDKGSHLRGNEYAASLGVASIIETGLVLNYFEQEGKLWGVLLNDGCPMPNGEYLLNVEGDVVEVLARLLEQASDAESYTGKTFPIFASDNLVSHLQQNNVDAQAIDVGEQLAQLRKPKPFQLNQVKRGNAASKPRLMYAILGGAAVLAVFRDDIWTLFETEEPITVQALAPTGPTPEQKYLEDLNATLGSTLNGGPQTVATVFEIIRRVDVRTGGWRLKQIECESNACKLDWARVKRGVPSELAGATMTSLDSASTTIAYSATPGELGIVLPVGNLRAFTGVSDPAREKNMNTAVYPSLLKLMDLGYTVALGPATPLVIPPKSMTGVARVSVRSLTIAGGVAGVKEPLLVEAWKSLPKNVNVSKITLRLGKLSSDDRMDIQGTIVTVEGV